VEVIWHQAPGKQITIRQNIGPNFFQKEQIVVSTKKNLLSVVTLVVNVIKVISLEEHFAVKV
jgi:hypothetical protein